MTGTPQSPVNWTNPEDWIPQRLHGTVRILAQTIWQESQGKVNPRYVYGHWYLACIYQLLQEGNNGQMRLTERGQDFVQNPQGETVALIDEREGLLKLLTVVAEKGTGRRGDFIPAWTDYLKNHQSRFGTDSTIKNTLGRRLTNLLDRSLLARTGTTYSITDRGLEHLKQTGGDEETNGSSSVQDILKLIEEQKSAVRASMQELLATMDPIAFEHLIKQLLEAMNYQNVVVTAPSNDKGVDVVADIELGITSVREVVQAKRQKANVQRTVMDALRGSLHRFQAVRGTIITTSNFSKSTIQGAFDPRAAPITLINGEKLIDLLIEYDIGTRKRSLIFLELNKDAFVQLETEAEDTIDLDERGS